MATVFFGWFRHVELLLSLVRFLAEPTELGIRERKQKQTMHRVNQDQVQPHTYTHTESIQ